MSEFFKLLEAVAKLERVLHCNRTQAERFIAECYKGVGHDEAHLGSKLNLFMQGGIADLIFAADDGGRRVAAAVFMALHADGFGFTVTERWPVEGGSFNDVEFDHPADVEADEDLGHLTLTVQPGDMSLLQTVFSGFSEDCIGSDDPGNDAERDRVDSLYQRITMGADPQRAIQIDLRDGDVESCHIDGVRQDNISVALQEEK